MIFYKCSSKNYPNICNSKMNYERSIISNSKGKECFEVLINNTYGGFHIPTQVRDEIFKLHPPHTEEGQKLFNKADTPVYISEDNIPEDVKYYIIALEYEDFIGEYKKVIGEYVNKLSEPESRRKNDLYNYVTRGDGLYYSSEPYIGYGYDTNGRIWREHKDVIRLCKELDYIDKEFDFEYYSRPGRPLKCKNTIVKIPVERKYNITDYDGLESIELKPIAKKVIKDLLRIIQTGDRTNLNEATEQLLNGEISIGKILSMYN